MTNITLSFAGGGSKTYDYAYDEVSRRKFAQRIGNGLNGVADGYNYGLNGDVIDFHLNGTPGAASRLERQPG